MSLGESAPRRDLLAELLAQTRRQNARRRRHAGALRALLDESTLPSPRFSPEEIAARLRRAPGADPAVIAEVKFRSPSAGPIRPWAPGEAVRVARAYERGGAAAISVLVDALGFGGSHLGLRRVAASVSVPVLFKGFVLDEAQLFLARRCGASLVLLLVRAMEQGRLGELVDGAQRLGLVPVVEAADPRELRIARDTGARVVGVNARDLRTFEVDLPRAAAFLDGLGSDRVGVLMSGVRGSDELSIARAGRADAVLVGEALMRAEDPEVMLRRWRTRSEA